MAFFWIASDLDPANNYNGWVLSRLGVGESLVKLNDELKVEACLADSWENVDETTWKFHIREGVMFSNGKAVDAEAVKASIERAISMNDRAAEYLKVDSMEADGQDLTIKTTEANAALLNNLFHCNAIKTGCAIPIGWIRRKRDCLFRCKTADHIRACADRRCLNRFFTFSCIDNIKYRLNEIV